MIYEMIYSRTNILHILREATLYLSPKCKYDNNKYLSYLVEILPII